MNLDVSFDSKWQWAPIVTHNSYANTLRAKCSLSSGWGSQVQDLVVIKHNCRPIPCCLWWLYGKVANRGMKKNHGWVYRIDYGVYHMVTCLGGNTAQTPVNIIFGPNTHVIALDKFLLLKIDSKECSTPRDAGWQVYITLQETFQVITCRYG